VKLYAIAKNIKIQKALWFFMACYFFNSILDAPNVNLNIPVTPFNEQETIIELVVEKILNFGDVIPETNDTDNQEQTSLKKLKLEVYFSAIKLAFLLPLYNFNSKMFCFNDSFVENPFHSIFSPPPELIG
jgi:hypothetical protein